MSCVAHMVARALLEAALALKGRGAQSTPQEVASEEPDNDNSGPMDTPGRPEVAGGGERLQ